MGVEQGVGQGGAGGGAGWSESIVVSLPLLHSHRLSETEMESSRGITFITG